MPGYITLYKFTPQGLANVKESSDRILQAKALFEKLGGRAIGVWVTLGEYDLVAVGEAPNDEVAAQFALIMGQAGNVTSHTMRAFSEEEFAQIVSRLP
jgi:uncharacterized protein with GYD domain